MTRRRPKITMMSVFDKLKRRRARRTKTDDTLPAATAPATTVRGPKPPAERKGNSPTAWRIAGALGTTPRELALQIGVDFEDIDEMFKGTSGQSAIAAGHPAWFALGRLVDEQIGLLMGVQAEIQGKRELDAKRLRERLARAKL